MNRLTPNEEQTTMGMQKGQWQWEEMLWGCRQVVDTSLVAQIVKNLPAMRKTQVRGLGQEDPLEKEMTTHSSILAWEIPWTEEPGGPVHGVAKSQTRMSD